VVCYNLSASQTSKFFYLFLERKFAQVCNGPVGAFDLFHPIMMISLAGYLGLVRDGNYLAMAGKLTHHATYFF
jgi:hypothetical protein